MKKKKNLLLTLIKNRTFPILFCIVLLTSFNSNIYASTTSHINKEDVINSTDLKKSEKPQRNDKLYLNTEYVTKDIINYAKEQYSNMGLECTAQILGLDESKVSSYELGAGFIISHIDDSKDLIVYFPILDQNEVVALLTVIKQNGEYYSSFGVNELSNAINMLRGKTTENNPFYLLSDENGIISVTEDLTQTDILQLIDTDNTNINLNNDIKDNAVNTIQNNSLFNNFSEVEISDDNTYEIEQNKYYTFSASTTLSTSSTYKILSVDMEEQSGEYCYAYTGSAIIRYLNGKTSTPSVAWLKQMFSSYTGSNGTSGFIKKIMTDNYSLSGVRTGVMSYASIKSQINNDKPIYSEWWSSDDVGHSLAIVGYYTGDVSNYIYIKDPNFPTSVYSILYSSKSYSTNKSSYGNRIFEYTTSVYSNK